MTLWLHRYGWLPASLLVGAILLTAAFVLGSSCAGPEPIYVRDLEAQLLAAARGDSLRTAEDSIRSANTRADSLQAIAEARQETAIVAIERWDTITLPSPVDTAAIVRLFPRLVATGDSLALACDDAIRSCAETVAAKDSVIDRQEVAMDLSRRHGEMATEQWRSCSADLSRMIQTRPRRDGFFAAGGALAAVGLCRVLGGC